MKRLALLALFVFGSLLVSSSLVSSASALGASPHPPGGPMGAGAASQRREDTSSTDPSLPVGRVVAHILDARDAPQAGTTVDLVVTHNSVAEGKSEEIVRSKTDATGLATFSGLPTDSSYSFRLRVQRPPARYQSEVFALGHEYGHRVTLHVFPATSSIEETMVAGTVVVYLEPLDDVFHVSVLLEFFNGGDTTWVPEKVGFRLPDGWKAFSPENAQGTLEVAEGPGGVILGGSVGPGRHGVVFGFRVPREDSESASIRIGLPPRVVSTRVILESSPRMRLRVAGFPEPIASFNQEQERILATQLASSGDGSPLLDRVDIQIGGLATRGNGRWYALVLAFGVAAWGGSVALRSGRTRQDRSLDAAEASAARKLLVAELVAVEKTLRKGRIGPETHHRARDVLMDAVVRIDLATKIPRPTEEAPSRSTTQGD